MGICSYVYRWLLPDSILCPELSISERGVLAQMTLHPAGESEDAEGPQSSALRSARSATSTGRHILTPHTPGEAALRSYNLRVLLCSPPSPNFQGIHRA